MFVNDCMNAVWKKNKWKWHQATKPWTFLTLLPPIGAYKLLIRLPCTSKLNKKFICFNGYYTKEYMHSNTKIYFNLSDKQQFLLADTFLLDAGSHVTFGLATRLVYRYIPIGCSPPRDLWINNFCCYQ